MQKVHRCARTSQCHPATFNWCNISCNIGVTKPISWANRRQSL